MLSVEELTERIALMNSEIERLQAADDQEARVKGCGEQFFQVVSFSLSRVRGRRAEQREAGGGSLRESHLLESHPPRTLARKRERGDRIATRPMADMANEG